MDDVDEELLRAEAIKLCAPLELREQREGLKRSWLGREWPERTVEASDKAALAEYEKCISQSFLRDTEDLDSTQLRGVVETALSELFVPEAPAITYDDLLEKIDEMSDLEVVKEIPRLMKPLPFVLARSLYLLLISKAIANRESMQGAVLQKIGAVTDNETIAKLASVVRGLKKKPARIMRRPSGSFRLALPEDCTFLQAAEVALSVTSVLPLRCLRAMVHALQSKPFEAKLLLFQGSNREQLAVRIKRHAAACIEEAKATGYVEPLQKALRVVKLYSDMTQGDDGGLSKLLDPPLPETDMLHKRLLFSISQLINLSVDDLEAVYHTLLKDAKTKYGKYKQLRKYGEKTKAVLEEALYRCTESNVPEFVVTALDMIAAAKPLVKSRRGTDDWKKATKCTVAETEALFDLSSSLQHVIWEWIEDPPFKIEPSEEPPAAKEEAESSEDDEDYLMSYTFDKLETECEVKEAKSKKQFNALTEEDDKLESVEKGVAAVADEAAALVYVVLGRAMEESIRAVLKPDGRRYLRSGPFGDSKVTESSTSAVGNQEDLLMRVLQTMPSLPPSVVENISVRLQELKEEKEEKEDSDEPSRNS